MSEKIFDVNIRIRVVANGEQLASRLAIRQVADWEDPNYVPMGTTLDSSVEVSEYVGDDLPVLNFPKQTAWSPPKVVCPDGALPDGPECPVCGGERAPSGVDRGTWVHIHRE
jgi:hypothetical protein